MKKYIFILIFPLLVMTNLSFGLEVKLVKRFLLSQEKTILMSISCFAVTEDEMLILPDVKDGNIKFYDNTGNLIKIWGRRGPGPDEFQSPMYCDYQKPYYIHLDLGKMRISIYKRAERAKFVRINEILCVGCFSDVRLLNKNVLVAGNKEDSNGNKFALYVKDFEDKETHYLLPSYVKYGFKSAYGFDRKYGEISPIGVTAHFHVHGDYVYYVWEGRLRIVRINLKTKKMGTFGQETKNYVRPKVTKGILEARRIRKGIIERKEKEKMSWVTGVFADEDFIGLIYTNFDKVSSLWKAFLQLYSPEGELMSEVALPDAVTYVMGGPSNFYKKDDQHLYILSRRLNEEGYMDEYEIFKYKIIVN